MSNRSTRSSKQAPSRPDRGSPAARATPSHPAESTRRRVHPSGGEPNIDALDDLDAPPIHSKVHPINDLSDAVPTLDDDLRDYHHHPNDNAAIEFDVDPAAADAAADLAGDLGSEFLEGATRGQDMSEVIMAREDAEGEPSLQLDLDSVVEPLDEDPLPAQRITPRRAR